MTTKAELMDTSTTYEVNGEEVKLSPNIIRNYLVSGNDDVTDEEVILFLNLCRYQKLNPFLNEAYLVKFNGKPAQIITSKEAFMKRAESHEDYDGLEAGIVIEDKNGNLIDVDGAIQPSGTDLKGGWAKIYRKSRTRPVYIRIAFSEFSKGQATWNVMPSTMIRKTAIVNGLREAFPKELGAMYTEEESGQPKGVSPAETIKQEIKENANQTTIDFEEKAEIINVDEMAEPTETKQEQLFDAKKPPIKQAEPNGPAY